MHFWSSKFACYSALGWGSSGTLHVAVFAALLVSRWHSSTVDAPVRFHGLTIVVMAERSESDSAVAIEPISIEPSPANQAPILQPEPMQISRATGESTTNRIEQFELPAVERRELVGESLRLAKPSSPEVPERNTEVKPVERALLSAAASVIPQPLGHEILEQSAQLSSTPVPRYLAQWKQQGWSGTALLRLSIGASGRVEKVELVRSSGFPELDDSAMKATRQWSGRPRMLNGRAVACQVLLPVVFD